MADFPPLSNQQPLIQIHLDNDIKSRFFYLQSKSLENIEFGGSRAVFTLVNSLLEYPVMIGGDYDFTTTSSIEFMSTIFDASKHMNNLFYPREKGIELEVYVPKETDQPDINIAALKIKPDGSIKDSTGQGLFDLYNLEINRFGNPSQRMYDDPRIPLRIIKYKLLLTMYGFKVGAKTEDALFNFKMNPQINQNHLRAILKKELSVFGDIYLNELNHYGLLNKFPNINFNTNKFFQIKPYKPKEEAYPILKVKRS